MDKVSQIIEGALERRRKLLLEHEAETICREYGISTVRFKLAETEEEAVKAAEEIGCPVALKIVSPDIPHKTEV
ncbi:acetate--CoA ligase family protein, partial [Candidatus Bathyarchaeota archaeon]|nr:acetate--CoA ligase family protein [Candidatus Bathyarchaeota archaeon]